MPDSVRRHIDEVRNAHDAAVKLIDNGIADKEFKIGLKKAGVSHVLVEPLKTADLRTKGAKKKWIQVVRDDYMRMLTHYSVEYDVIDAMFSKE